MKKWIVGVVLFVFAYVFFVVAHIPAQWVISQANLPKNIQLQSIQGTVWNAKVERVIANGYVVNQVSTHVNLLSLLSLNPSVDVTFGGALVNGPEGYATISNLLDDVALHNAKVSVLANDVAQQLTLPIPLTAKKYIDVTLEEFVMGQPICSQLNGLVQWNNASVVALDETVKLGSLKANLSCDKGQALLKFDPKNDLGLTLTVKVQSPERVSADGYIQPGKNFPSTLNDALAFLGSADKNGRYKINF